MLVYNKAYFDKVWKYSLFIGIAAAAIATLLQNLTTQNQWVIPAGVSFMAFGVCWFAGKISSDIEKNKARFE